MITLNDVSFNQNDTFSNYIYINQNSLSDELCNDIIDIFNKSNPAPGCTAGGVNKQVKDTNDIQTFGDQWNNINTVLMNEMEYNLRQYVERFHCEDYKSINNNSTTRDFKVLESSDVHYLSKFMVQKYEKNKGRYVYHNDFSLENTNNFRIITYLWYLNDVVEGGETVFNGKYKIKPRRGTLVLFPASWTFPHCGKMPISSDKYIITGWMYSTHNPIFKEPFNK
jgi:hypothetical protein